MYQEWGGRTDKKNIELKISLCQNFNVYDSFYTFLFAQYDERNQLVPVIKSVLIKPCYDLLNRSEFHSVGSKFENLQCTMP